MKYLVLLVFCIFTCASLFVFTFWAGYTRAKSELPSCIYIERPRGNDIKPFGYDGKEGVDVYADHISGGGIYVSLEKWKRE